jgi:hypothetical protein
VPEKITHDDLMRFLDGELPPEEHARVQAAIAASTELAREAAIHRAVKGRFQEISFHPGTYHSSVWDGVNQHLTRPIGWILFVGGAAIWAVYGVYVFLVSPAEMWEKLATGAVVVGILALLVSVIWERYREWLTDPYRDIQR